MPRVIGIDPGTVSIDLCGLDDGRLFLDETFPTAAALSDASMFVNRLKAAGRLDLVVGPSGYGLPCINAADLSDVDLRLAFLAAEGEGGGIGGLRKLVRALASADIPVVLTPGVIHLASVPDHRKVNRVDMGTADKLCAAVLAVRDQATRWQCPVDQTRFVLLELGGAFTAALAVSGGRIVDGVGGSSGPLGMRAAGALDGEVAFLAGEVSKAMIFRGGAAAIAGGADADALARSASPDHQRAWMAYTESAVKTVAALRAAAPDAREVILSGRVAHIDGVREQFARRLEDHGLAVVILSGRTRAAAQAAEGAAMLADGLAGGEHSGLVELLGVREARGTLLDHLYVISREQAKARLGIR